LFIVFNRLEQFAGVRHTIGVFSGRRNTMGVTHEKGREMNLKDAPVYSNIAHMGIASTSNSKPSSKPELAIDGKNTGFKWKKGYWQVSFAHQVHFIRNIKLKFGGNGKLCNDMTLEVLDASDEVVFTTGPNIHCTGAAGGQANVYVGMEGYSVRVTNKKKREMNLIEAQVFGYMKVNLAFNGLASQSSIGYSGAATRGNDGNTDGNWSGASVTHTANERQPWWKVDLGGSFPIHTVKLYNRIDCCEARLSGFQVQLLDSEGSVVASKDYDNRMIITNSMTMIFDDIKASQVKVLLKDTGVDRVLSLAEVEVFSK